MTSECEHRDIWRAERRMQRQLVGWWVAAACAYQSHHATQNAEEAALYADGIMEQLFKRWQWTSDFGWHNPEDKP